MTTEWRRFHPAAVAFDASRALGGLAVPLLVAAFGGGGGIWRIVAFGLGGVALAVLAGAVRWRTNEWRLADGAVSHRAGWLNLTERSVPLARVQSVDAIRGPLQRLFGVAAARIQTAGGSKEAEIVLPALTADELRELRAAAGVDLEGAGRELPGRRLGTAGLVVAGLTAGSAGVIVAVAVVVGQVAQEVYGDEGAGALREAGALAPDTVGGWIAAGAALLGLAWLLGVIGTVTAFAGFDVVRDGDRLRITRGALWRRETSITVGRVRAVRVVEGVLRQPFGLAAVRVDVLGAGEEPPAAQTLFPLLRRAAVPDLLEALLPEHPRPPAVDRAPGRAWRPYVLPPAALAAVVGAAAWIWVPGARPWTLAVVVPVVGWGLASWRAAGIALRPDAAALRYRRLARTTAWFDPRRSQWTAVGQTVFQRRARLASVRVSLGRGARADVRHLAAPDAWRLWRLGGGADVAPQETGGPARSLHRERGHRC